MEIDRQPTSSVAGLKGSPRGEQLVGPVPELVPAAELNPVGQEEEERFPLAPRVEPRLAPVAEVAPGHRHAHLPAVEGTESVIAASHRVLVTALAAARLVAQRVATELVTIAVEAVVAWEVAVTAAAVEAVVAADVVVAVVAAAEAGDKRTKD
jgi:hypothetical protein